MSELIKLVGKTRYGKQRIQRDGDVFEILERKDAVTCLGSAGMFIKPVNNDNKRWIATPVDTDFEVIEIKE